MRGYTMVENEAPIITDKADKTEASSEEADKTCLPCLLPDIMAAWNSTRAACEFLPTPESKTKCREEMEKMAKNIKDIKSAEDVIFQAIESSTDPDAFIEAEIEYAIAHNAANSAALIRWAAKKEAAGEPIAEKTAKVINILRLEQGI